MNKVEQVMMDALQKLCKWRSVFAGWQLGTRPKGDPEGDAVRDHREVTMLLRAEVNALTRILVAERGPEFLEHFQRALTEEAQLLDKSYEEKFPGMRTFSGGVDIDVAVAKETTKGWRP